MMVFVFIFLMHPRTDRAEKGTVVQDSFSPGVPGVVHMFAIHVFFLSFYHLGQPYEGTVPENFVVGQW